MGGGVGAGSGVARAFPGGRLAHPEGQNEEENKLSLRKNKKICLKFEEKMRKVELLPTRDCEAGYGPGCRKKGFQLSNIKRAQMIGDRHKSVIDSISNAHMVTIFHTRDGYADFRLIIICHDLHLLVPFAGGQSFVEAELDLYNN